MPGSAMAIEGQSGAANEVKLSVGERKTRKPYTLTLWKHYGRTLDHVLRLQPSYIRWLVLSTRVPCQPKHFRLKAVLLEAGLLEENGESDKYEAGPRLPRRHKLRFLKVGPPPQAAASLCSLRQYRPQH